MEYLMNLTAILDYAPRTFERVAPFILGVTSNDLKFTFNFKPLSPNRGHGFTVYCELAYYSTSS